MPDPSGEPVSRPHGPLLRDPPLPPGYVDPIKASDVLEDPFAADNAPQPTAAKNPQVRKDDPRAGAG